VIKVGRLTGLAALVGAVLMTSGCSDVLPKSFSPGDIRIPTFFPESPDAGPEATAPANLAVPSGNRLILVLVGSGYQEYECKAKEAGPQWSLLGPDATLYGSDTKKVGTHSFGPIWTYADGSVVHGKVLAQAPSKAHNSVPQLLLSATTEDQEGVFKGVSFVQRLRTVGGLPPDYGCDEAHLGAKLGRQYSAYYLFYKPLGVI
jgi:hypothetical protein